MALLYEKRDYFVGHFPLNADEPYPISLKWFAGFIGEAEVELSFLRLDPEDEEFAQVIRPLPLLNALFVLPSSRFLFRLTLKAGDIDDADDDDNGFQQDSWVIALTHSVGSGSLRQLQVDDSPGRFEARDVESLFEKFPRLESLVLNGEQVGRPQKSTPG